MSLGLFVQLALTAAWLTVIVRFAMSGTAEDWRQAFREAQDRISGDR